MKTPFFWYQTRGRVSTFLQPLGWLYGKGVKIVSVLKKPQRFQIPIVSIGNIVCGGAGKTPTAITLAQLLQAQGYRVHFVTRGYGRKEKGPLTVDLSHHKAWNVGDESLLLAQHAPTWVAKKKSEGVQKAIENGAQLIILDDGHQTNSLYKDVSLVVVDLLQGFGNECVMPAGPLRENLSEGIRRADGFIGIGKGEIPLKLLTKPSLPRPHTRPRNDKPYQPFFKAQIISQPLTLPSNRVIAFCGLGFPQKFYTSLENTGVELIATETFPDHYQYKNEDLLKLQKLAQKHNSVLVTTQKDLVKIPPLWQDQVHVLDINIQFENPKEICDFILQKIHPLMENTR